MSRRSSRALRSRSAPPFAVISAIAGLLPILLVVARPASARQAGADPLAGFDAYVARGVEEWQVPGLAVAVVKDGRTVFERGYGARRLGAPGEVDEHTLFAIGSTTKAMTAAAIGMLVDEGKLGWDDRVIDHMPWFRLYDAQVTRELRVRDLLAHSAGLPNADYLWYEQDAAADEIVRRLALVPPSSPVRSHFVYQNVMYAAAGLLVEAVGHVPWAQFVRNRIFEPLGMADTVPYLAAASRNDNVASPHDTVDDQLVPIENASVDSVAAAGAVWSSVHDMALWSALLLRGGVTADGRRLLSEATVAELFRPQAMVDEEGFYPTAQLTHPHWTTYGLGWFQADYEGRRTDFHTGSIDGMVAIHGLLRDEGVGVIVLANRDHTELRHALMYRVFDLYDADPPRDWNAEIRTLYDGLAAQSRAARQRALEARVAGTHPSLPVPRYAGTYSDPLYGEVEVTYDGSLRLRYGRRTAELEHWNYDTFLAPWQTRWRGEALATFVLDRRGGVARLEMDGMTFARQREGGGGSDSP